MIGTFQITSHLLVQMLCLPEGTKFVDAVTTSDGQNVLITVSHDDIKAAQILPHYEKAADGPKFVKWGDA